jgi:RNA polymerase sigma factor (TIGR02999 family)
MSTAGTVTRLLRDLRHGGRDGVDRVFPRLYQDLRRLASSQLRGERPDHTLGVTDVVHEAYLELAALDRIRWHNRAQFFAVAAQAMRRVLIDYAVERKAQKRGGGWRRVPFAHAESIAARRSGELLALNEALERLTAIDPRYCRVVECRYFAGLSIEETAEALDISAATVKRDWMFARAWLHRELAS